jgi:hypothetical protein
MRITWHYYKDNFMGQIASLTQIKITLKKNNVKINKSTSKQLQVYT